MPKERRVSRGSNTTTRGQPPSPSEASFALSPTTAQSSDIQTSPPRKASTFTSKRTSSALNGLQQVSNSLSRKRTISATSEIERPVLYSPATRAPILRKASSALTSGSVTTSPPYTSSRAMSRTTSSSTLSNVSGGNKSAEAKIRMARVRMSLDSGLHSENDNQDSPTLSAAQRRERRFGNDSYSRVSPLPWFTTSINSLSPSLKLSCFCPRSSSYLLLFYIITPQDQHKFHATLQRRSDSVVVVFYGLSFPKLCTLPYSIPAVHYWFY
jgi:hypothetical protein